MVNCVKETALMLAKALRAYGVTDIFSSPGSRNAPMVVALVREPELNVRPIIDERSAGFIALGYASISQRPAALVCTSGTALLNYAPAVAEAYYRKVPLIVISADRPAMWIGQDDSQTIRQPGALSNIVKATFNLKGEILTEKERWEANRTINEALQTAIDRRYGPVHINISFDEPLTSDETLASTAGFRKIELITPSLHIDSETIKAIAEKALNYNILITGGFCPPSAEMNRAFAKLAKLPSVVIAADALANINAKNILNHPDLFIDSELLKQDIGRPSMLITFGGALLSRKFKEYLRNTDFAEHWHIGCNESLIDSYFSLSRRVEINEKEFFTRFANAMEHICREKKRGDDTRLSEYKTLWNSAALNAEKQINNDNTPWSDRQAIFRLLSELPADWNLQLSNGLTPRHAVCGDAYRFHRRDCNRGVSGIDGSVSTAVGASAAYKGVTLLITGDMSMQYDIAALSNDLISPKLKIIVINNGGGGIFRKISSTGQLPELNRYFTCKTRLPLADLAKGYGFEYFTAASLAELISIIPKFVAEDRRAALLEVKVPPVTENNHE